MKKSQNFLKKLKHKLIQKNKNQMKEQIQFNHDTDSIASAFGTTSNIIASQLTECIKKFTKDDRSKVSVLGEIMHNNVDYNVILLFATERAEELAVNAAKSTLEKILDKLED